MLGDRYIQNNDIIEKAINNDLKTLKDNDEIQGKGEYNHYYANILLIINNL